ncbi:MAG: hypothetical protein ACE5GI_04120 [Candidatus Aminicenantales bacterium]
MIIEIKVVKVKIIKGNPYHLEKLALWVSQNLIFSEIEGKIEIWPMA